jgi:hypothetical protein
VPATRKTFSAFIGEAGLIRRGYDFRSLVDNVRTVLIMARSHRVVKLSKPTIKIGETLKLAHQIGVKVFNVADLLGRFKNLVGSESNKIVVKRAKRIV